MLKIAITGGIGSGKSAVANCLQELGYVVYSCDEIYKTIIVSPKYVEKVSETFPECIENGEINRKILASIVFQNERKLQQLNDIAHPLIMERLFSLMNNTKESLVFAEVPLLFESRTEKQFDKVIIVQRDIGLRMEGVAKRDGLTSSEIEKRMQAQFDYSKLDATQFDNLIILKNDGDLQKLKIEVCELIKCLKNNLS